MIVAMASSKNVCGGNTGRACPDNAPVATPPVTAAPTIPSPKPSPAPTPSSSSPSTSASLSVSTQTPSGVTGSSVAVDHTSTAIDDAHAVMSWSHTVGSGSDRLLMVGLSLNVYTYSSSVMSVSYAGQNLIKVGSRT